MSQGVMSEMEPHLEGRHLNWQWAAAVAHPQLETLGSLLTVGYTLT